MIMCYLFDICSEANISLYYYYYRHTSTVASPSYHTIVTPSLDTTHTLSYTIHSLTPTPHIPWVTTIGIRLLKAPVFTPFVHCKLAHDKLPILSFCS